MKRSRAEGTNPRAMGTNPRALRTNPNRNKRVRRVMEKQKWKAGPEAAEMLPQWLRFEILKRDRFRCAYCGARAADGALLQVDHVKPKFEGGTDDPSNLTTSCQPCNRGKGARLLDRSAL